MKALRSPRWPLFRFPSQVWMWGLLLAAMGFLHCEEEIDLFASPEDIWVVYGVLDPNLAQQDFRISKAFQTESNAFTFAQQYDPSVQGMNVWLSGAGKRWEAIQIDSVRKDTSEGDFGAYTTVYRIQTPVGDALEPGQQYTLFVAEPGDTNAIVWAETRIPPQPQMLSPTILGSFEDRCLMSVPFEDSVTLLFKKKERVDIQHDAYGFQVAVDFSYRENGVPTTFRFGPSRLFTTSQGCGTRGGGDVLCFRYPRGAVMTSFRQRLGTAGNTYELESDTLCGVIAELPRFLQVQVTAVDSSLGRYMLANDPRYINFNTYRQEYSNLEGTVRSVGIFGAVHYDRIPVKLTPCGMYLLGFNQFAGPSICD